MVRLISIALILIFSIPLMLKTELIVSWKLNQKSIIERFCVNKNKPKLQCNGKCHLGKQLSKVEEPSQDDKQVPFEKLVRTEPSPFLKHNCAPSIGNSSISFLKHQSPYKANFYAFNFLKELLNPPQVLK